MTVYINAFCSYFYKIESLEVVYYSHEMEGREEDGVTAPSVLTLPTEYQQPFPVIYQTYGQPGLPAYESDSAYHHNSDSIPLLSMQQPAFVEVTYPNEKGVNL